MKTLEIVRRIAVHIGENNSAEFRIRPEARFRSMLNVRCSVFDVRSSSIGINIEHSTQNIEHRSNQRGVVERRVVLWFNRRTLTGDMNGSGTVVSGARQGTDGADGIGAAHSDDPG